MRKSARTCAPRSLRRTSVKPLPLTPSTRSTRGHHAGRRCGPATVCQTTAADAAIVVLRRVRGTAPAALDVVAQDRADLVARQLGASAQEAQLDQERAAGDDA